MTGAMCKCHDDDRFIELTVMIDGRAEWLFPYILCIFHPKKHIIAITDSNAMNNNRIGILLKATGHSTALQELLYGFIMGQIFVNAALLGTLHFDGPGQFVTMVIGMNTTWGAIDALIFYYLGVCDQRRYTRLVSDKSLDREYKVEELMDEFGATPLDVLSDRDKKWVCEKMLDRELQSDEDNRKDRIAIAYSSLGCFIITVLTIIPIAIPVLLISDFETSLRVANLLVSIILFFVGYYIAPYLGLNRIHVSITLMAMCFGVSLISVFTGG
jgi:hypothetical protein